MRQNPLVSVIIPVYNVQDFLRECLNSVVHQSYSNLEILLIDDGSTDASGEICDEYARSDARVRVIHKSNGGQASARNAALELARGEFLTFVDSDDVADVDLVRTLLNLIKTFNVKIAMCGYKAFESSAQIAEIRAHEAKFKETGSEILSGKQSAASDEAKFSGSAEDKIKFNVRDADSPATAAAQNGALQSGVQTCNSQDCASQNSAQTGSLQNGARACAPQIKAQSKAQKGASRERIIEPCELFRQSCLQNPYFSTGPCRALFASEIFKSLRFPQGQIYEDVAIFFDMFNHGATACTSETLYFYRIRAGSTVNSFSRRHLAAIPAVRRFTDSIVSAYPQLREEANFTRCESALNTAFMVIRSQATAPASGAVNSSAKEGSGEISSKKAPNSDEALGGDEAVAVISQLHGFVRENLNFRFFMRHANRVQKILMVLFYANPALLRFLYKIYKAFR
ncbi:glycosyltransferase family 2 protein [uncultured Campylobacter sp.]|uniref:glycosyltransferase family 2 protein n=1 Tax=uncultured Campylobacter sp. TaxID=218934 RepID=UPI002632C78D|nr:glycosyltransferase family 2 protein [uncultured Campylobacter sp.]